jgi:hypothetical protein
MARIQGIREVELVSLSGTTYQNSSSFSGSDWHIVIGPTDISMWSNVSITLVNNHVTNKLQSGSVEFSVNSASFWETDWDVNTFAGLTANGGVRSMQIAGNSRKWIRVRVIPSGSSGALTGSVDAYLHVNNG